MNANLAKAAAVGALGGLLFGFDTAVISGATAALTHVYSLTPEQLGLTVSMALIGTVIGAMTAGIPGQKYGGRETLPFVVLLFYPETKASPSNSSSTDSASTSVAATLHDGLASSSGYPRHRSRLRLPEAESCILIPMRDTANNF